MIEGLFGIAWTEWGAAGLSGGISGTIQVVGIVVGAVIVARSARLRRSAPAGSESMFRSRRYRFVVVLEVAGLVAGAVILHAMGDSEYAPAWSATVIGVHFLAFGRFFYAKFYWLGAAMLVGAVVGALVGLGGGGNAGIEAASGLIAATSLFAAGGWSLFGARTPDLPSR